MPKLGGPKKNTNGPLAIGPVGQLIELCQSNDIRAAITSACFKTDQCLDVRFGAGSPFKKSYLEVCVTNTSDELVMLY